MAQRATYQLKRSESLARRLRGSRFRYRVPASASRPKRVFEICHYCGYSPPEGQLGVCPKCLGSAWERFALAEACLPETMK